MVCRPMWRGFIWVCLAGACETSPPLLYLSSVHLHFHKITLLSQAVVIPGAKNASNLLLYINTIIHMK